MDTKKRIPHEGVKNADDQASDGLRASETPEDTEGHRAPKYVPGTGTGGDDFAPRRPSTGGELIDENDVEGHKRHITDEDGLTINPGTGGDDFAPRRPSTGGELIDENDVEGHRAVF